MLAGATGAPYPAVPRPRPAREAGARRGLLAVLTGLPSPARLFPADG
jgi:hypothetical protein